MHSRPESEVAEAIWQTVDRAVRCRVRRRTWLMPSDRPAPRRVRRAGPMPGGSSAAGTARRTPRRPPPRLSQRPDAPCLADQRHQGDRQGDARLPLRPVHPRQSRSRVGSRATAQASTIDPESRAFRQVAAGAHPNLLVLRRPWDDQGKRYRTELTVGEVRRIQSLLRHRPQARRAGASASSTPPTSSISAPPTRS